MAATEEACDVAIVGGGVSACLLAPQLVARGLEVVICEAGDESPTETDQSLLTGIRDRVRNPSFDIAHTYFVDGAARGHFSQGRSLGGGSNINGGLWIPPSADDLARLDLPPAVPPCPVLLEVPRFLDATSIALGNALARAGATWPQEDLVLDEPKFRVPSIHRGGRRTSLADLLKAAEGPRLRYRLGTTVSIVGSDVEGAFLVVGHDRKLRARRGIVVCAGALGSPGLIGRSLKLVGRAFPRTCTVQDHLALRFVVKLDEDSEQGSELLFRQGGLTKVGGLIEFAGTTGADGSPARLLFLGAPVGVRWPHWGRAIMLGDGFYTFTIMLCRGDTVGELGFAETGEVVRVRMELSTSDLKTLVAASRATQTILQDLIANGALDPRPMPLTAAKFCQTEVTDAFVRRKSGTMHHPVGSLVEVVASDGSGAVPGLKGVYVVDSSTLKTEPQGTIMPVLAAQATAFIAGGGLG